MSRLPLWLLRVGAAALFVAVFFGGWQPVRAALAVHVLAPLLQPLSVSLTAVASPPSVNVPGASYAVPGGLHLLVPGIFLALVAPRRPYVFVLWGVLLALGALALGAFALGLVGWASGFAFCAFVQHYVVPPVSLGVPLLLLARDRLAPPVAPPEGLSSQTPNHTYRSFPIS